VVVVTKASAEAILKHAVWESPYEQHSSHRLPVPILGCGTWERYHTQCIQRRPCRDLFFTVSWPKGDGRDRGGAYFNRSPL